MNSRRFLIALAVVVPASLFFAVKIAVRWRPILVGALNGPQNQPYTSARTIRVGHDFVAAGGPYRWKVFDLSVGSHSVLLNETRLEDGGQRVQLRPDSEGGALLLRR